MAYPETSLPFQTIQTALRGRLNTNNNTQDYDVYDEGAVPQTATFPYVVITRLATTPVETNSTTSNIVSAEIRVIDKFPKGEGTRKNLYDMGEAITKALTTSDLSPITGWNLYDQRREFIEVLPFEDDTHTFYELIMRFRYRIQYTA